MKKITKGTKEYDLYPDGEVGCSACGTHTDVTTDESGEDICTDCLFERECENV